MLRRTLYLCLIVVFIILFSGCSHFFGKKDLKNDTLSVYILHTAKPEPKISESSFHINHPEISLKVKTLDSYQQSDEMDQVLTEIIAGGGPDVLLHLNTNERKSASLLFSLLRNGSLCDLEPFIEASGFDKENYRPAAFTNSVNDRMLTISFASFSNMIACTKEREEKYSINFSDNMSILEFSKELDKYIAQTDQSNLIFGLDLSLSEFIIKTGEKFVDYQNNKTFFNTDSFRDVILCYQKIASRKGAFPTDAVDFHINQESFIRGKALLYENTTGGVSEFAYAPIFNAVMEQNTDETLDIFSYPSNGNPVSTNYSVGCILERCSNKEAAFDLLITEFERTTKSNISSNLVLSKVKSDYETSITVGAVIIPEVGYPYERTPLPVDLADRILNNYETSVGYVPDGMILEEFVEPCMKPFLDGEASLDECIEELEHQVNIYLNE